MAVEAAAVQQRDFLLGLADRVVDQVELNLEFFALFDLRAIGLNHCGHIFSCAADGRSLLARRTGGFAHLLANGAKFAHDFVMKRHHLDVRHRGHRSVVGLEFFDPKTLALNRHLHSPTLDAGSCRPVGFNIGFTPEPRASEPP